MSNASSIPLWGQAWELTVTYATATGEQNVTIGSSAWDPESLRITFETLQSTIGSPWWYADISIYNMTDATVQNTLFNATWAVLKAGFQTGPNLLSTIWDGPVFQVLYDREEVVDQKVTLHCVANPGQLTDLVAFSVGPFSSQNDLVARMAAAANLPPISPSQGTQSQTAKDLMTAKKYPRGNGVFGRVNKFLNVIAQDNNIYTFQDGRKVYMTDIGNTDLTPTVIYSPAPAYNGNQTVQTPAGVTASIIGTPQQTQYGADFTVLLDPRVKVATPSMVIELDRSTFIRQTPVNPDVNSAPPTPFTADLKFFVGQVRHSGDSRGNTWQTDITGYNTTYAQHLADGFFAPIAGGK